MFENIGSKIKGLASVLRWIGIGASILAGLIMFETDDDLFGWGFLTMIVGPLMTLFSSFLLYGFGELVENSAIIAGKDTDKGTDKGAVVKNTDETLRVKSAVEEKIEKLDFLKNKGYITEEEYNKKKSELLEKKDEK